MGKVIFLICILAALVHQNVSKPSSYVRVRRSSLSACAKNLKLPAILNTPETRNRVEWGYMICGMQRFAMINPNNTVNWDNVSQYISKAFIREAKNYDSAVSSYQNCASSAAAGVKANDTTVDVYGAWLKCLLLQMD